MLRAIIAVGIVALGIAIVYGVEYHRELAIWWKLRKDFRVSSWRNEQGRLELRHIRSGIVMVYVRGGEVSVGEELLAPSEAREARVRRSIRLEPFLIAKYEVSQREWGRGQLNPSLFREESNLPVDGASWDECRAFCERFGLRLPTEEQWECACRAGTDTRYAFGDEVTTDQVNFAGPLRGEEGVYRGETLPVDALEPNAFGLHHVHGNVAEWCEGDPSEARPGGQRFTSRVFGPSKPRVARGGSWISASAECRSAAFSVRRQGIGDGDVGFRPVYVVP